jgi:lipoprotein-anchoring transpeptidase ErfK/SrfK
MVNKVVMIILGFTSLGASLTLLGCGRQQQSLVARAANTNTILSAVTPNPPIFRTPPVVENSFLDHTTYALLAKSGKLYPTPDDELRPSRVFEPGLLRVTISGQMVANGETWYEVNRGEYARGEDITILRSSNFRGVLVQRQPELPFGWIIADVRPSKTPGAEPDASSAELKRYAFISAITAIKAHAPGVWYEIGNSRWVESKSIAVVGASARPKDISESEFWTDVNLDQQTLAAYEGARMVFATLLSSGLEKSPTREGLFSVRLRAVSGKMSGDEGTPDYYYTEDVPYVMYFDKGIALHGAYWHDRFGSQVSHGCVNLPPKDAEWLYSWSERAPRGLKVWVHSVRPSES